MVKKFSVYSCASVLAVSFMVSGFAEITGSGFRNTDCSGVIHINLWMDYDGDGIRDRVEPAFPKVDIYASLTGFPGKGVDKFSTGSDGTVQIDSLCKGVYTLEIDEAMLPAGAMLGGVFEFGETVMDPDLIADITVGLSEGSDRLAPGERYLDIAYEPFTGRYK